MGVREEDGGVRITGVGTREVEYEFHFAELGWARQWRIR